MNVNERLTVPFSVPERGRVNERKKIAGLASGISNAIMVTLKRGIMRGRFEVLYCTCMDLHRRGGGVSRRMTLY